MRLNARTRHPGSPAHPRCRRTVRSPQPAGQAWQEALRLSPDEASPDRGQPPTGSGPLVATPPPSTLVHSPPRSLPSVPDRGSDGGRGRAAPHGHRMSERPRDVPGGQRCANRPAHCVARSPTSMTDTAGPAPPSRRSPKRSASHRDERWPPAALLQAFRDDRAEISRQIGTQAATKLITAQELWSE